MRVRTTRLNLVRLRKHASLPFWAAACLMLASGPSLVSAQDAVFRAQATQPAASAPAGPARVAQRIQNPDPTPELEQSPAATRQKVNDLIADVLEPEVVLNIVPQRSKLMRTKRPVTRFSITRPNVAEVVQFSPTEFEIIGLDVGITSMTLWFGGPDEQRTVLRYLIKVSRDEAIEDRRILEYHELQDMINEMFPNSGIQLIPIADKLIVRGQARDAEELAQIMAVLRARGSNGNVGNTTGFGAFGLSQGDAATVHPGATPLPTTNLINLLTVPGEQQVMLKVRVAELSRTALRELGVDWAVAGDNFFISSVLGNTGNISAILDGGDVELMIKAFSSNSYSKVLAEPNLVTLSGRTANFIAGGQFAVPTIVGVGGAEAVSTQFQGFGTQLSFTPTVLDKDRVRLQVVPTFSELNSANSVGGIPGLNTRSVSTTVDMREGQWLAIAGLIEDKQRGSKARVPLLGDIPILDTLFSNRSVDRNETELLVLVSPELVHPMEPEQVPLLVPGAEVTEPDPAAFFLEGKIEGHPGCHHRSTVWPNDRNRICEAIHEAKQQAQFQKSQGYYFCGEHGFSQ